MNSNYPTPGFLTIIRRLAANFEMKTEIDYITGGLLAIRFINTEGQYVGSISGQQLLNVDALTADDAEEMFKKAIEKGVASQPPA